MKSMDPRPLPRRTSKLPLGTLNIALCFFALGAASHRAAAQTTGFNKATAGPFVYTDSANWVGGNINGIWDSSLTLTGNQNATFSADTVLTTGLNFGHAGNFTLTLRGDTANRALTLGGDIIVSPVTASTVTIGSTAANQNLNVNLGGQQRAVTVSAGKILNFQNVVSNGSLLLDGGGTVQMLGANTYSGSTSLNAGVLKLLSTAGSIAGSDVTINGGTTGNTTLTFDSTTSGVAGATRAKTLTFNGIGGGTGNTAGTNLQVSGNATVSSTDTILGAITANTGNAIITLTANTGATSVAHTQLNADSFVRNATTTALFRGSDLGLNTIASSTAKTANIFLTNGTTLTGAGGAAGTSTVSIMKGSVGDTTSGGGGFGTTNGTVTGGLLTYDSTYGVRLLTSSEYKTSITDGQTQLDNIRLTNTTGNGIASTTLIEAVTKVNSLSFNITGDAAGVNGGIVVTGTAGTSLVVDSGVIYSAQLSGNTGTTTNSAVISVPTLDLNGHEGVITAATSGVSASRSGSTFDISSAITNDGGNGVTIGGNSGTIHFIGSASNTYTGVTTVNSGLLFLQKSGGANAIPGDLVINGGSVEQSSNQIADTSNITINGGSYKLVIGNQGVASQETFNNLTMTGGSYSSGAGNHNGRSTINGFANLSGGSVSISQQAKIIVVGKITLSGATIGVSRASSTSSVYDSYLEADSGIDIVNTATGAYTPISIGVGASSTNFGGRVDLKGDLTFTGNATNANTTIIAATTTVDLPTGVVALNGARTFQIGDGAASTDLSIQADVINGSTASSLNKTGAGTLELLGVNTYTGATTVSNGALIVGGSITASSGVSVSSGARLAGTGTINAQLSGAGSVDPGNSPGLMTAASVNPAGGLDFNFEFTARNVADLTWAGVQNDVLRVTGGTPFSSAFGAGNVLSLYLDTATYTGITSGDTLLGGFYTDAGNALGSLSGAGIIAYYQDAAGAFTYNGLKYSLLTSGTFAISEAGNTQFALGGNLTQFTFTSVPETSAPLLAACGLLMLGLCRRRH